MAVQDYGKEREYGAVAAEEQAEQDVAMAAMVGDQTTAEAQAPIARAQGEAPPPPRGRGRHMMNTLPPNVLFPKAQSPKPAWQRDRDVALLFESLAADDTKPDLVRQIANRLRAKE